MSGNEIAALAFTAFILGLAIGHVWTDMRALKKAEAEARERRQRDAMDGVKRDINEVREMLERHLRVGAGHK